MSESTGFESLGAVRMDAVNADRIVIGVLEDSPGSVALALGSSTQDGAYYLMECDPGRARDIAQALAVKANSIEATGAYTHG